MSFFDKNQTKTRTALEKHARERAACLRAHAALAAALETLHDDHRVGIDVDTHQQAAERGATRISLVLRENMLEYANAVRNQHAPPGVVDVLRAHDGSLASALDAPPIAPCVRAVVDAHRRFAEAECALAAANDDDDDDDEPSLDELIGEVSQEDVMRGALPVSSSQRTDAEIRRRTAAAIAAAKSRVTTVGDARRRLAGTKRPRYDNAADAERAVEEARRRSASPLTRGTESVPENVTVRRLGERVAALERHLADSKDRNAALIAECEKVTREKKHYAKKFTGVLAQFEALHRLVEERCGSAMVDAELDANDAGADSRIARDVLASSSSAAAAPSFVREALEERAPTVQRRRSSKSPEKKYGCSTCSNRYYQRSSLLRHQRVAHT